MRTPVILSTGSRFLVALLAGVVSARLVAAPAPPATGGPATPSAPKPTLVFFLNPAGGPCQTQDRVLKESRAQWEPLATLRYVRTDVPADREVFYQYGVRSLPNLILVGADGREIHRYPPGIQSAETILSGIRQKSGR
jgi:thioredoxin-like negative regulator of GroEL